MTVPLRNQVVTGSTVGETPLTIQLPHSPRPGKGKGLMMDHGLVSLKHTVLLHKDLYYANGQLSSIIKADDYEDLGNHATEATGEMGLFSLSQVCIHPYFFPVTFLSLFLMMFQFLQGVLMMKGLMDRCMARE